VKPYPITREKVAEIFRQRAEGRTIRRIAWDVHLSDKMVYNVLKGWLPQALRPDYRPERAPKPTGSPRRDAEAMKRAQLTRELQATLGPADLALQASMRGHIYSQRWIGYLPASKGGA